MNALDLISAAVGNSVRSKTRTILTVLAIFIGAFTLTLTSGVGTGINRYIDDTVASIGASDVITVTKTPDEATGDVVVVALFGPGMELLVAASDGRQLRFPVPEFYREQA